MVQDVTLRHRTVDPPRPDRAINTDRERSPQRRPNRPAQSSWAQKSLALSAIFALAAYGVKKSHDTLPRALSDIQRMRLSNDVQKRYADIGGVENAPQGECIKTIIAGNPVTNPSINPFGDHSADMFERFDKERRDAEQRADESLDLAIKMDFERVAIDKELNVRYLSNTERESCVVTAQADGAMVDPSGKRLSQGAHIVVIDQDNRIYSSPHERTGAVNHSSFLAGAPVKFAGFMIVDEAGKPEYLINASGHYKPPASSMPIAQEIMSSSGIDVRRMHLDAVPNS